MWVWLEVKLASKGGFCVVSCVRAFFVNFFLPVFMHSPEAIPEWANVVTFHPRHKICNSHLKGGCELNFYMGLLLRDHTLYHCT